MDLGLTGKVAVITGSTRGLGLASATSLVAEGCHVCVCGRTQATLDAAVASLTAAAAAPVRFFEHLAQGQPAASLATSSV